MITQKTLKLSLKSLRDFAKKRLPDETLIEPRLRVASRRVPLRLRQLQAPMSTRVVSRLSARNKTRMRR